MTLPVNYKPGYSSGYISSSGTSQSERQRCPQVPSQGRSPTRTISTASMGSNGRPPSRVYTRGTIGAVKTSNNNNNNNSNANRRPSFAGSSTSSSCPRTRNNNNSERSRSRSKTPSKSAPSTNQRYPSRSKYHMRVHSNVSDTHSHTNGYTSEGSITSGYHSTTPSVVSGSSSYVHGDKSQKHQQPSVLKELGLKSTPTREREMSPPRDDAKHHVRQVRKDLEDLCRLQGNERRIVAISNVCEVLDHWDEQKHNMELYNHCASLLTKALQVVSPDDEIRMICAALEMVFRGSAKSVQSAYDKLNGSLVLKLLRIFENQRSCQRKHADVIMLDICKIIMYLSRCPDLRAGLCRFQGLLEMALANVSSNNDIRVTQLKILGNLAHSEENKVVMYEYSGLVSLLYKTAHSDSLEGVRQHAGAALMDLASAPANQLSMASNDRLLGTLVKMTLTETAAQTREYAITALQNLAFAKENRAKLVNFKSGIVLEALKKTVSSDSDAKARRRAAGALTNLACEDTAQKMASHKGLMDALAVVSTTDESMEVQTRACLALTKVATHVTLKMACHSTVLDALIVASMSKADNSTTAVLRVKARDPDYREAMARHPGVLDTLADICIDETAELKDRDNATRALMHLVNEDKNQKIMCSKRILEALTVCAEFDDNKLEEARDSAIIAIERLATEFSNRSYMARHPRLLTVIAQAVERESAWEEQGRESEHGYLAKPLLMSLLVAM